MTARLLEPAPPGEILYEEFMKPLGVSINALAREIAVPPNRVSEETMHSMLNVRRLSALGAALLMSACASPPEGDNDVIEYTASRYLAGRICPNPMWGVTSPGRIVSGGGTAAIDVQWGQGPARAQVQVTCGPQGRGSTEEIRVNVYHVEISGDRFTPGQVFDTGSVDPRVAMTGNPRGMRIDATVALNGPPGAPGIPGVKIGYIQILRDATVWLASYPGHVTQATFADPPPKNDYPRGAQTPWYDENGGVLHVSASNTSRPIALLDSPSTFWPGLRAGGPLVSAKSEWKFDVYICAWRPDRPAEYRVYGQASWEFHARIAPGEDGAGGRSTGSIVPPSSGRFTRINGGPTPRPLAGMRAIDAVQPSNITWP
ncbi:MAG: hypothetical protein A3D95_13165 [Betaproteobacteria bacterium RIFCSPHIGHO2_12_FULL_69_13]|nr:MAG: hypothetical protein A3D95_13165 [Betaproteobacteria bacterium RIFCSPHIGHO2_12_FULL_69_13]OGA64477.1 MAG: hypothetical protein A3G83_08440 [Betaproteobacteria bacterium RIFCSPLOWO2_12_FULL_68_20]